jgi:hypothetical protein
MRNYLSKIKASRNALYFHSASIGLLYVGGNYSSTTSRVGYFTLRGATHYLSYTDNFPIFFLAKTCFILALCQLLLTLLGTLFAKSAVANKQKSAIVESFINALTGMNISLLILVFSAMNLIYIPSKLATILLLLFSFVASLSISYTILNEDDSDNESILKKYIRNSIAWGERLKFPLHRQVGTISIVIGYFLINSSRFPKSNDTLIFVGLLIGAIGGIYSFIGVYYRYKKIDELERQIILEQSFVRTRFFIGVFFITFIINVIFNINLSFMAMLGVFTPIMILSEALIKDKYE